LQQQAEKLGISLSDTQLEQMLAQQPSFKKMESFLKSCMKIIYVQLE
jgi:peptidyl-prolyl cis-trans isomerase D